MADILTYALMNQVGDVSLGNSLASVNPVPELRLFVNDLDFDAGTVTSDLTECTAPGYAAVTLDPATWVYAPAPPYFAATYPTVTFTFSGPGSPGQTVYGYAVIDTANAIVMWGNRLLTPYVIPPAGGTLLLTPAWQDTQCP